MSLVPFFVDEMLRDLERPLYDQHFGLGLWPSDNLIPTTQLLRAPLRCGYMRPWRLLDWDNSGISNIINDKDGLKINLDVQQFKPEELNVKVVDDYVVVEGKHEERSDEHGFISRQFSRRYKIPENVDKNALKSSLSSDGVLQLEAPKVANHPASGETSVPIVQTNKPAIKNKEKKVEKMES
ncbi:alpha-crystallin A chain-like [Macrosteles quadrilineatus]|uniref:alpha-crystallin A chain-like n=1 Tax=Macrosteles quadrilineatus TaxID=74068 RepID=UPI0023E20E91|nr:alpha-crystallin A chain-like [Macrosteles quadrilineatus]